MMSITASERTLGLILALCVVLAGLSLGLWLYLALGGVR